MSKSIPYRLHHLIHQLTTVEKSHVRKNLKIYREDSDLLFLFEKLNKIKIYDKDKVKAIFSDSGRMYNTADSLISYIVRALSNIHVNKSIYLKALQYLAEAELFYQKRCNELLQISVDKGIMLTENSNFPSSRILNLQFKYWKIIIALSVDKRVPLEDIKNNMDSIFQNIDAVSDAMKVKYVIQVMMYIGDKFLLMYEGYNEFMQDKLYVEGIAIMKNTSSFESYNIYFLLSNVGKWEEAHYHFNLILNNISLDRDDILRYLSLYIAALSLDVFLNDEENYKKRCTIVSNIIDKYKNENLLNYSAYRDQFWQVNIMRIIHFAKRKEICSDSGIFDILSEKSCDYSSRNRIFAMTALFYYFMSIGDKDRMLYLINKELNHPEFKNQSKYEIYCIHWHSVLCYFEYENISLLNSRANVLKRYINKFRPLNEVEQVVIKTLINILAKPDKADAVIIDCLRILKQNIELTRSIFGAVDIVLILESKLSNPNNPALGF